MKYSSLKTRFLFAGWCISYFYGQKLQIKLQRNFIDTTAQTTSNRRRLITWSELHGFISLKLYSSINTYLYTIWMIGKIQMAHNKSFNWNNRLYTSTWNDFYGILAGQLAQNLHVSAFVCTLLQTIVRDRPLCGLLVYFCLILIRTYTQKQT